MIATPATLVVVSASPPRALLLHRLLEQSHPRVVSHVASLAPVAVPELAHFIEDQQPWLVVYDLGEPYDQSLAVCRQVRALDRDLRRQYLLTVAQRQALSPDLRQAGVIAVEQSVPDLVELLHAVRALLTFLLVLPEPVQ